MNINPQLASVPDRYSHRARKQDSEPTGVESSRVTHWDIWVPIWFWLVNVAMFLLGLSLPFRIHPRWIDTQW